MAGLKSTNAVAAFAMLLTGCAQVSEDRLPAVPAESVGVIDTHYHAAWQNGDDAAGLEARLEEMDAKGISVSALFVTSEDDLDLWFDAAPRRFIAGPMFPCPPLDGEQLFCFDDNDGWPDLAWVERELQSGRIGLLGELTLNYYGIPPTDPRLDPYFALAARYDVPVLAHTNSGPPPRRGPRRYEGCCPDYDPAMGDPALWRPVLEKYPGMRLVLQHSGFPYPAGPGGKVYLEETFALMRDYPDVYADMSVLNALWDEDSYRLAMQKVVEAGMIERIMFGSDNNDPTVVFERLARMEFLSDTDRRAILHDNAARFFRLDAR